MKKLLAAAQGYVSEMSLWDVAGLKLCLAALGVLVGLLIPRRSRRLAAVVACLVFFATYLPLMVRFLSSMGRRLGVESSPFPAYEEASWED